MDLPTEYQSYIHRSRYARFRDADGRREYWGETVARYFDYFEESLDEKHGFKVSSSLRSELQDAVSSLAIMPSMRALMTAGEALRRENLAGYNCSYVPIDRPRAFAEVLYILMCGTGVGFSVERQVISDLPPVPSDFSNSSLTIVVGDSKMGWADAFEQLIDHLFSGRVPEVDYSQIRAAGERLKVFGGRASGPDPLRALFEFTVTTFRRAAGRRLNSLEVHEIVTKTGEIVVVGGVRRSAEISLSNLSDQRMRDAKSGNWWAEKPHLALANNSVAYTEKPEVGQFLDEWSSLYRSRSGERGIFNRYGAVQKMLRLGRRDHRFEFGTNPCVTGDTLLLTRDGEFPIAEVAGQEVDIWNGMQWSRVTPFSTGINPIMRVTLSGGKSLRCTPYHKFVVSGQDNRVEARDLELGDILRSYVNPDGSAQDGLEVVCIEGGGEHEETFCVTEPLNHTATFNGIVTGNCGEIVLRPRGLCNLSEVIGRASDGVGDIREKARLAAIIGTWQSTQTAFNFVEPEWQRNAEEERLLGVSITGIYDNAMLRGDHQRDMLPGRLQRFKEEVIRANRMAAHDIGITPSVACTTVKPSGTVSQLVGCTSGIHPARHDRYLRRVTGDNKDPLTMFMRDAGIPHVAHPNKPDDMTVFSFPTQPAEGVVTINDVSAIEHMELVRLYNRAWSEHAVSCTISVREHEWPAVGGWVYDNFDEVAGMSFLPHFTGDTGYDESIIPELAVDENRFAEEVARMPTDIDWSDLRHYEAGIDSVTGTRELACVGNACEVIDAQQPL